MGKGGDAYCIFNCKTKRVKEFQTIITDGEFSYNY